MTQAVPLELLTTVREELEKTSASLEDREPINIILEAENILKTGNPLEYILCGFRQNHKGHEEVCRSIIYASVAQSSMTTKGIQPSISGEKGSGKSHAARTTTFLMPGDYLWETSLSTKSLYYHQPPAKCIIYMDEAPPEGLVDILKNVISNFQRKTQYKTIIDKKAVDLTINEKLVFINTSVHQRGDDQFKDRMMSVGILNEKVDNEKYYQFENERRKEGRPEFILTHEVKVCREIFRHIKQREFVVHSPDVDFAYKHDNRLMNYVWDLMEGSCILNYLQRHHEEIDGIIHVYADQRDLSAAIDFGMFTISDRKAEGRLSRAERALDEKVQMFIEKRKTDNVELTEGELADLYGKTQQAIRKLVYGDGGNQNDIKGGLLEKAPWYTLDRQEIEGYQGILQRTGQTIIRVHRHVYEGHQGSFAWIKV